MEDDALTLLLRRHGGLVARRDHPELVCALEYRLRKGELVAVLPGVYAPPDLAGMPLTWMRAACLSDRDAVLTGAAAARLTFWPSAPLTVVEVAARVRRRPQQNFAFQRRVVPPELVTEVAGLRCTLPALTAVELATMADASAVDIALRTRRATLAGMHAALAATSYRAGNRQRLQVLLDSRDEPWSEAERRAHRLLRDAGVVGWKANVQVRLAGRSYYLDIAFGAHRLAVEIDGRIHEQDLNLFESDRWRQNALVQAGWRVLRFTWAMLVDHPDVFVAEVRAALRMCPENAGSGRLRPA